MKELHTEIEIHAAPAAVWQVLTDLPLFEEWNPFVTRASGKVEVGEQLSVHMEPPGGKPMTFTPKVIKVVPEKEFRWLGHLLVRGLFDGEHIFELEPLGEGRLRFVQREKFRGLLVPLIWKSLDTNTRAGFEAMNRALKERAEARM